LSDNLLDVLYANLLTTQRKLVITTEEVKVGTCFTHVLNKLQHGPMAAQLIPCVAVHLLSSVVSYLHGLGHPILATDTGWLPL